MSISILRCFHSASVGSDCHRCGGCAAHPHLLLLHNQKMLLQEEEEQEREEGQGWLQHEEHAGRRGMVPCVDCMLKDVLGDVLPLLSNNNS